jgi:hypothetical protein
MQRHRSNMGAHRAGCGVRLAWRLRTLAKSPFSQWHGRRFFLRQQVHLNEYSGTDPASYVASSCNHRNLTTSQRAMIAAGFLEYEKAQAKKRSGTRTDLCENFHTGSKVGRASDKAGERMHVGGRTVDDAAKVLAQAIPEVVEKVRRGDMKINEAKVIARFNPAAQGKKSVPAGRRKHSCQRDNYYPHSTIHKIVLRRDNMCT